MSELSLRLEVGDAVRLGPGKMRLLELIAEHGSISAAGRAMGMSYRHAWLLVDSLNNAFREPVVLTRAGGKAGAFEPMPLKAIAAKRTATGGPITASAAVKESGHAPGFSTQFCDVEVDPETGAVKILRWVAAQDVGRAVHPAYVDGQIHGGVVQGIGWALNEEYIYDKDGHLSNAGFLDYRMPVCSDLPMIETLLLEVPNPNHP